MAATSDSRKIIQITTREALDQHLKPLRRAQHETALKTDVLLQINGRYTPAAITFFQRNPIQLNSDPHVKVIIDWRAIAQDNDKKGLIEADLSGVDLNGIDFTGCNNLEGIILAGANLSNTSFVRANLSGADARGAHFQNATFQQTSFKRANLSEAIFDSAAFNQVSLVEAKLYGASLKGVNLMGMDLSKTEGLNLTGAWINQPIYAQLPKFYEGTPSGCGPLTLPNDLKEAQKMMDAYFPNSKRVDSFPTQLPPPPLISKKDHSPISLNSGMKSPSRPSSQLPQRTRPHRRRLRPAMA